jgi:hypothetical protein
MGDDLEALRECRDGIAGWKSTFVVKKAAIAKERIRSNLQRIKGKIPGKQGVIFEDMGPINTGRNNGERKAKRDLAARARYLLTTLLSVDTEALKNMAAGNISESFAQATRDVRGQYSLFFGAIAAQLELLKPYDTEAVDAALNAINDKYDGSFDDMDLKAMVTSMDFLSAQLERVHEAIIKDQLGE